MKVIPPVAAFSPDAAMMEIYDIFCDGQAKPITPASASHIVHPVEAFENLPAFVR